MAELTKEHFDSRMDHVVKEMVTKKDLKAGIEELARMVANGFLDIQQRLDVRVRVEHLETDMNKIKGALNMV